MATKKKTVLRPTGAARLVGAAVRARNVARPTPAVPSARAPARRAEQLVRDVTRLREDITSNFYRMGLALRELSERDTYRSLGYATFADLLEARDLGSRITAFKLVSIVETLPEPLARRLGVEKSYDAIRYARLVHPRRDIAEVVAADPVIRLDARERIPLFTISSRALNAAVRALQAGRRAAANASARAKRAARSLAQHLDHAGIDADRVRSVQRGHTWRIRIDLTPEEAEQLATLLATKRT